MKDQKLTTFCMTPSPYREQVARSNRAIQLFLRIDELQAQAASVREHA